MKKVVFCEIAWMKYYAGITEEDKPLNGGKYVKENNEGGEVYNFSPYNHKCYGYVMHYGNELHIERYDKTLKNHSETTEMTVVWVASDGTGSKIVGWYEHAKMYREWQAYWDPEFGGDKVYDYNFVADEKNCYLIDEDKRKFIIPRAPRAGKGRGMGQSQVWYADSDYAQEEFIPKVLAYLDSVRESCQPFYFLSEELEIKAEDKGSTVEELLEECRKVWEKGNIKEAMALANLAIYKEDSYETRCMRADLFFWLGFYDEAEEEYKITLYNKEELECIAKLMYIEKMLKHTFLAIELGEKIRKRKSDYKYWTNIACELVYLYIDVRNIEMAQKLINQCEQETDVRDYDWIEGAREYIESVMKEEKDNVKNDH